jgi:hypothetical protein
MLWRGGKLLATNLALNILRGQVVIWVHIQNLPECSIKAILCKVACLIIVKLTNNNNNNNNDNNDNNNNDQDRVHRYLIYLCRSPTDNHLFVRSTLKIFCSQAYPGIDADNDRLALSCRRWGCGKYNWTPYIQNLPECSIKARLCKVAYLIIVKLTNNNNNNDQDRAVEQWQESIDISYIYAGFQLITIFLHALHSRYSAARRILG